MIKRTKVCGKCRFCDKNWGWYCTLHSKILTREKHDNIHCPEYEPYKKRSKSIK